MNLKTLNNEQLLQATKCLIEKERKTTVEIIQHLQEIQSRRLHAELGYSSLFEYCVKELGYSEGAAARRLAAVKITNEMPEVKKKIEDGKLHLSSLVAAQSLFTRAKKQEGQTFTTEQKTAIITSLEGTSKRESEKKLAQIHPETERPEILKSINEHKSEIRMIIDSKLERKLAVTRDFLSHKSPNMRYSAILEYLTDYYLKKEHPLYKKRREASQIAVS